MGEWLVLLYFSVQMLHVVMVLLVWFVGLLVCFYMILTVCLVCGVVVCCVWCVGDCGLKVPSKN